MTSGPVLGDRHLRPDPSGALRPIEEPRKGLVRIVAPLAIVSSSAGQQMAWMLVNQLVRQDRLVERIALTFPDSPLLSSIVPFAHGTTLGEALRNWSRQAVGERVIVELDSAATHHGDIEIHLGNVEPQFPAERRLCILGNGWNVYAGPPGSAPQVVHFDSNPLGPYFAACIAAGEVFKHLRQVNPDRGSFIDDLSYSLLDLQTHTSWDALPVAALPAKIPIGAPYLVGAGAVGQAFALALGSVPSVCGHITVVDPESLDDITNLNRYPLARLADFECRRSKVQIIADYLRSRGLTVHPVPKKWQDFLRRVDRSGQLPELAQAEATYQFSTVLSCIDDTDGNLARHAIQNVWPRTLMGASTHGEGLRASISLYDIRSQWMCLKCHNPIRDSRKELAALVDELRNMSPQSRALWTSSRGMSAEEVEQALTDPGCSSVGMRELSDYVSRPGDPQFSVGFTSMAAGIILAAQLIKSSIGMVPFPVERGCSHFFYFLNPGSRWIAQGANPHCNCRTEGRDRYQQLWAESDATTNE